MVVTIFENKFMENLEWLHIKTTHDIPITSYYLIDDKICYWYDYIEKNTFGIIGNSGRVKCGLSG